MSDLIIGTSGYDYPEWKGVFYPEDLPRKDFLGYYATQFNGLELNNTFYNMPTAERMLSFYERSEGKLKFSVKANRLLTHEISNNWNTYSDEFIRSLEPLVQRDSLSSILFQFPESFHYIPENRLYLSKLIDYFKNLPVVIEFRHKEWIRDSVFEGLIQRGASIAFCDMPQLKNLPDGFGTKTPFIGRNAYLRLHGRNANSWYSGNLGTDPSQNGSSRYCYEYSDSELDLFVPVVVEALKEGRTVQMFFNNHPNGGATKNAKKFQKIVK